jgi:hypothetical protein
MSAMKASISNSNLFATRSQPAYAHKSFSIYHAIDSGFIQIITTSTGSTILDTAAAGGCFGGMESAPQELKDLKIRFGEFIGRKDPGRIKRAGFGVHSEVVPLKKVR